MALTWAFPLAFRASQRKRVVKARWLACPSIPMRQIAGWNLIGKSSYFRKF
jgi:hypothetical protein